MLQNRLAMRFEEILGARDEVAGIFCVVLVKPATHHVLVPLGREFFKQLVFDLHNVSHASKCRRSKSVLESVYESGHPLKTARCKHANRASAHIAGPESSRGPRGSRVRLYSIHDKTKHGLEFTLVL
jgi:hypothetical protein